MENVKFKGERYVLSAISSQRFRDKKSWLFVITCKVINYNRFSDGSVCLLFVCCFDPDNLSAAKHFFLHRNSFSFLSNALRRNQLFWGNFFVFNLLEQEIIFN